MLSISREEFTLLDGFTWAALEFVYLSGSLRVGCFHERVQLAINISYTSLFLPQKLFTQQELKS